MYHARLFAIRHSRGFEWIYQRFEAVMIALDPVFTRVGYDRIERPVALVEHLVKNV